MKQLIVSRFNEDVDWVYDVDKSIDSIIVYNKGEFIPSEEPRVVIKNIPNFGREAETYCRHFAQNRSDLADTTFLAQGKPFDHSPDFLDRLKLYGNDIKSMSTRYLERFPTCRIKKKDYVETYKGFEIRLGNINHFAQQTKAKSKGWFSKRWDLLFDCPRPDVYYYGYAAMWCVPKENIIQRSQEFWDYCHNALKDQNPRRRNDKGLDAWSFEALWNAIFDEGYKGKL